MYRLTTKIEQCQKDQTSKSDYKYLPIYKKMYDINWTISYMPENLKTKL